MKTIQYTSYIMLFMLIPIASSFAGTDEETKNLSNTMLVFMAMAGIALLVTYLLWKMNDSKRKASQTSHNKGPVKRPLTAYHKRKAA